MRALMMMTFLTACLAAGGPTRAQDIPIEHAYGTVSLPAPARHVVALEYTYVENLLALGMIPVGLADKAGYRQWVGFGADRLDPARDVGTRQEPSLEVIAALKPDLIVGPAFRHGTIFDKLTGIAPTVLFDAYRIGEGGQYREMVETFETLARATGRSREAADYLKRLDETLAEAQATLADAGLAGASVLLVQFLPGSPQFRVFTRESVAGAVLERLGLINAWDGDGDRFGFVTVGVEALARFQDSHLVHVAQPDDDTFQRLQNSPIWPRFGFVKNDRVHALASDTWLFGGPTSAMALAMGITDAMTPP